MAWWSVYRNDPRSLRGFPEQTPDPILHMPSIIIFGVYKVFSELGGTGRASDVPKYHDSKG